MAIHCGRTIGFRLRDLGPTSLIQTHVVCESCSFPFETKLEIFCYSTISLKLKKLYKIPPRFFLFCTPQIKKLDFSNTLTCSPNSTSTFMTKSWNMYDLLYYPLIFNFRLFINDSQKTYTITHTYNIVTFVPCKQHFKKSCFKWRYIIHINISSSNLIPCSKLSIYSTVKPLNCPHNSPTIQFS